MFDCRIEIGFDTPQGCWLAVWKKRSFPNNDAAIAWASKQREQMAKQCPEGTLTKFSVEYVGISSPPP